MVECTNPRKIIETYKVQGGPSPVEVERAIKTAKKEHGKSSKTNIAKLKNNLADAERRTLTASSNLTLFRNSPSNVRLKNPTYR